MAAQKATELRRLSSEVAEDRARLKARQDELEKALVAAPAETWADAVEKARSCCRFSPPRRKPKTRGARR